jgi:hypothetical protein
MNLVFCCNKLIDSSFSDDEDNFYFDVANIIAETLLNEPIYCGSIVEHRNVDLKGFYSITYFIVIIFQIT